MSPSRTRVVLGLDVKPMRWSKVQPFTSPVTPIKPDPLIQTY
jgi:hypothetical protein